MEEGPDKLTVAPLNTVIAVVGLDTQPVFSSVKTNCAVPAATPVTKPVKLTVATKGLVETQLPPELGNTCVLFPIQILFGPSNKTVGLPKTVTGAEAKEVQPVDALVNLKVA